MMPFKFEFSLEVLNHLGRGLYRNFATVVAEAISNSWDAGAEEVYIFIDRGKKEMIIKDDGKGMSKNDFQEKFLKVGYSRRNDLSNKSKRKILGRKGIGKLALLSISEKITIVSKTPDSDETGGIIDNSKLDKKIKSDGNYSLEDLYGNPIFKPGESGTYLKFEKIKEIVNNPEIIKKYLAVLFNFSIAHNNEKFEIYVNKEKVCEKHLQDLYDNTQFLWNIGIKNNPRLDGLQNIEQSVLLESKNFIYNGTKHIIKGYIASVNKPNQLKLHGTGGDFKAGLHLFVNGRLRQEDIFKDITSNQYVESYLYGEIHVDSFDEGEDIFTSNREGVIKDNPRYKELLKNLKEIQTQILNNWDEWRSKKDKEDIDGMKILDGMRPEKRKIIEEIIKFKEGVGLKNKIINQTLPKFLPKKIEKQILICHASEDKKLASKVEKELLKRGIQPNKILYTSSDNIKSKLPVNTDIFNYIREFFIQDFYYNPVVVFVASSSMEKSWFPSLEAGATWVTGTQHYITTTCDYTPRNPLNIRNIYLEFDKKGNFKNLTETKQLFDSISRYVKKISSKCKLNVDRSKR